MPQSKQLLEGLDFISISNDKLTLFDWKPPMSFKSYILDLNIIKQNKSKYIFFQIDKGNQKIVHIRYQNDLLFSAGSSTEVQFQLLEAFLEHVNAKFNEMFDIKVIFSYGNINASIFKSFKSSLEQIINDFHNLDLVKKVTIFCPVCNRTLPLFVKKSFIENAESYPVPLVYTHKGHASLCFIDKNFDVRGVELVKITG